MYELRTGITTVRLCARTQEGEQQFAQQAFVVQGHAVEPRGGGPYLSDVRLALGGVGTKPWRARRAEAELVGGPATPDSFARAAAAELTDAIGRRHNAYKVALAQRAVVRALTTLMNGGLS